MGSVNGIDGSKHINGVVQLTGQGGRIQILLKNLYALWKHNAYLMRDAHAS